MDVFHAPQDLVDEELRMLVTELLWGFNNGAEVSFHEFVDQVAG